MSTRVGAKTKGYIKNNSTGEVLTFQFNPTSHSYSRSVTYADIASPGMQYPGTQFVRGNYRSFPVELFVYDRPFTGLITKYTNFIGALLTTERNSIYSKSKPPDFLFCYGTWIRRCVLESLDITLELSDSEGRPVQARFNMQIRQVSP